MPTADDSSASRTISEPPLSGEPTDGRVSAVPRQPLFGQGVPVIAGPCSAESEAQLCQTARELAGLGIDYLRAGAWKGRSRPGSFEGVGAVALGWLTQAAEENGLKSATEVACGVHVHAALEAGIDLVWIGARTTSNPFSVAEIAEALAGSSLPCLVKNPIGPDVSLWIGALERLSRAGVTDIGAIHRGVSHANPHPYRNWPHWEMVLELRRQVPDVSVFCDPSHISGRRDLVGFVTRQALDVGVDGLMIEVHPDPDRARSDGRQQLTPDGFAELVIQIRTDGVRRSDPAFEEALSEFRSRIDRVDQQLMQALAERMDLVEDIGRIKAARGLGPHQSARWHALVRDRVEEGRRFGLDPDYVRGLYQLIHDESVRSQSRRAAGAHDRARPPAERSADSLSAPERTPARRAL